MRDLERAVGERLPDDPEVWSSAVPAVFRESHGDQQDRRRAVVEPQEQPRDSGKRDGSRRQAHSLPMRLAAVAFWDAVLAPHSGSSGLGSLTLCVLRKWVA